ncbi:sensor histidine kinase [Massilia glaciei]|uniref:sensor histidine kinase n=1 Tax=Massilia glaciei TaxID=1524097 RepID=UPI001E379CC0|nr:sensor histidine kinase [Massilia glaciei]
MKYTRGLPGPGEGAALALTMLVFVPMYFASFWQHRERALNVLLVLGFCLLGALWARHNPGASTFFIFACAMCAGIESQRRAYLLMAVVLALALLVALPLGRSQLYFVLPALAGGIPIGVSSIMESSVRRSRDQLLRKQEEVEYMATIAERERISRDLHDLLGHTLSLITLKAELAGKLVERDPAACRAEIKDIETSARTALSEVRAAVTGYRQTGFAHELGSARVSLAAARVTLGATVAPIALPAAAENVLSLALREAVTNIVRHAGARHCELSLALEHGKIVLRVADDGTSLTSVGALLHGNGLSGMHERVEALGGTLALRLERGLALELRLPMGAAA